MAGQRHLPAHGRYTRTGLPPRRAGPRPGPARALRCALPGGLRPARRASKRIPSSERHRSRSSSLRVSNWPTRRPRARAPCRRDRAPGCRAAPPPVQAVGARASRFPRSGAGSRSPRSAPSPTAWLSWWPGGARGAPGLEARLRPLGKSGLLGHFHAAAFSYRPLPQGRLELQETVHELFEEQTLQGGCSIFFATTGSSSAWARASSLAARAGSHPWVKSWRAGRRDPAAGVTDDRLILSLLALGVFISFRIFNFPDITATALSPRAQPSPPC